VAAAATVAVALLIDSAHLPEGGSGGFMCLRCHLATANEHIQALLRDAAG
jgi:hypothetical protein